MRTVILHPTWASPCLACCTALLCCLYKNAGLLFQRFFVVVCSFQILSGNDIHHMTEGDFHWSCCAKRFSVHLISWEKSWMFCENCACTWDLGISYCVVQSCRVCVACSSCTAIFFVFFFMIMIGEYRACFILHSAWRWAHISKTSLN